MQVSAVIDDRRKIKQPKEGSLSLSHFAVRVFATRYSQTRLHTIHARIMHHISNQVFSVLDARLQEFPCC
jgi:hypothetical protein